MFLQYDKYGHCSLHVNRQIPTITFTVVLVSLLHMLKYVVLFTFASLLCYIATSCLWTSSSGADMPRNIVWQKTDVLQSAQSSWNVLILIQILLEYEDTWSDKSKTWFSCSHWSVQHKLTVGAVFQQGFSHLKPQRAALSWRLPCNFQALRCTPSLKNDCVDHG